jgi:alginate O-acetyltransferase complex protein AlgI
LIASIGFYAFAGFSDLILIASSIFANWIIVILFRRGVLRIVVAVVFNIGLLAFFKYRWFLFGNEINQSITFISDILPLGISFYCFQILSYHVDCVRRTAPEADSARIFALFVSFFPQLIAGPIVRPNQLIPALGRIFSGHLPRLWMPTFGLSLCLVGLVKKIVFADSLAPLVDEIFFEQPANVAEAWLGAWLFTFQIYFDFSGYSDIALGSAYLLGIRLPVNFRTPYVSLSPREFWQRWHITLSNWIRDYVYLPLGGNGGGAFRQAIVLVTCSPELSSV